MLITGAMPVASTAPKIPMPHGKINSQSRATLERLPAIIAAMASCGAPSLRIKHNSALFKINAGAKSNITCK